MRTALRHVLRVVTQVQQRVERTVRNQDHVAAATTISA
jgi:hypothetical protein